jgi:hypothetical protein
MSKLEKVATGLDGAREFVRRGCRNSTVRAWLRSSRIGNVGTGDGANA